MCTMRHFWSTTSVVTLLVIALLGDQAQSARLAVGDLQVSHAGRTPLATPSSSCSEPKDDGSFGCDFGKFSAEFTYSVEGEVQVEIELQPFGCPLTEEAKPGDGCAAAINTLDALDAAAKSKAQSLLLQWCPFANPDSLCDEPVGDVCETWTPNAIECELGDDIELDCEVAAVLSNLAFDYGAVSCVVALQDIVCPFTDEGMIACPVGSLDLLPEEFRAALVPVLMALSPPAGTVGIGLGGELTLYDSKDEGCEAPSTDYCYDWAGDGEFQCAMPSGKIDCDSVGMGTDMAVECGFSTYPFFCGYQANGQPDPECFTSVDVLAATLPLPIRTYAKAMLAESCLNSEAGCDAPAACGEDALWTPYKFECEDDSSGYKFGCSAVTYEGYPAIGCMFEYPEAACPGVDDIYVCPRDVFASLPPELAQQTLLMLSGVCLTSHGLGTSEVPPPSPVLTAPSVLPCNDPNVGEGNQGCGNRGNNNIGNYNVGSNNVGDKNVGSNNKGSCNTGSDNMGNGWTGSGLGPGNGPNWPKCKMDD